MSDAMPEGDRQAHFPSVIPYLLVADARKLIAFFEAGFGARLRFLMPAQDGRVMHAEVAVGDAVLMISDAAETPFPPARLCHYVADTDAVFAQAVAAGAEVLDAPETKEYGDRMAGIKDPAGNIWWICTRLG